MEIIRAGRQTSAPSQPIVLALGNFDGVHRGHQALIDEARREAAQRGAVAGVLTFEPHPREFFASDAPPFRLTSFRAKCLQLAEAGVQVMAVGKFGRQMAARTADDFINTVLLKQLNVCHVVVGYDFAFGHKRSGNVALLKQRGAELGFGVSVIEPVQAGGEVCASTRIRDALWQGDPRRAARLLGHWWEVDGRIQAGDQRGRTIGFPTANVPLGNYIQPQFGVYAIRIGWQENGDVVWHDGVANLGRRPTFDKSDVLLEAHVFDFSGDLYGRHCRVQFIDFLRPEMKFDGLDALKAQIQADGDQARKILADPGNPA